MSWGAEHASLRGWEPSGATPSARDALDRDLTPQIILRKYIDEFNNYNTLFCLNCLLGSFYLMIFYQYQLIEQFS
jgi:hypothetical protein